MADLSMPQRQTYPHITGLVQDERGPLPLDDADDLELFLEVDADSDLFGLPAEAVDPYLDGSKFFDVDGNEVGANFQAPIGASGVSDDVLMLRGKLKITWDADATPPLVQWAPTSGFLTVAITENVQDDS